MIKYKSIQNCFSIYHATVVRKFLVALVVLRRGCFSRSKQIDDGSVGFPPFTFRVSDIKYPTKYFFRFYAP